MGDMELAQLGEPFDAAYRQTLLDEGVMPAAVVCITQESTGDILAFRKNDRANGLPIFDLASMQETEETERYVSYKFDRRFGLVLPSDSLQLIPVESNPSPYLPNIGNVKYPDMHQRRYYPVVGVTDQTPNSPLLCVVTREKLYRDCLAARRTPKYIQLLTVYREIIDNYV